MMGGMTARRWTFAFGAWTIFCWATRVKNAMGDDDMGSAAKAAVVVWSAVLVAAGIAVIAARTAPVVRAVLVLTTGSWAVATVSMLVGGRGAAFVAVHLTLAVISIALGLAAYRETSSASVKHRQPPPALRNSSTRHSTTS
jgi:hypothetical protein